MARCSRGDKGKKYENWQRGDSDRLGGRDADGQNTAGEKQREDDARSDAQEQQEARRAAR